MYREKARKDCLNLAKCKRGAAMNLKKRFNHFMYRIERRYLFIKCSYKKPVYGLYQGTPREKKIILSLATYNKRYDTIIPALKSMLFQSVKPDKIVVWLDDDIPENHISPEMEELKKYGVEYIYTSDGLKPHKKYIYSMEKFPEDIVITVDDDLIYSGNLIKSLLAAYKKNPNCVCARRVHRIRFDDRGNLLPYNEWDYECNTEFLPSYELCATGGAGALYPPHILPKATFDMGNIRKYCLNADDIWLKVMELLGDVKVLWVKNNYMLPKVIKEAQATNLNSSNVLKNGNDIYINQLIKLYPEVLKRMREDNKQG